MIFLGADALTARAQAAITGATRRFCPIYASACSPAIEEAVQGAIVSVAASIGFCERRVRFDAFGRRDEPADAGPVAGKADADGGGPRRSETGSRMAGEPLQGLLQHIGHDLHPHAAGGAAIGDDEAAG